MQTLHADGGGLDALSSDGSRLDPLGADLSGRQADAVHGHQLHVVEVDRGGHAHSGLGGQGRARSLGSNFNKEENKVRITLVNMFEYLFVVI